MKLVIILLCTLMSLTSGQILAQTYDITYGKPLIVLIETDPWLMVKGSDVATFALYEKGQVIYKVIKNKELEIYQATLTQKELQKVIESFSISDAFYTLKD